MIRWKISRSTKRIKMVWNIRREKKKSLHIEQENKNGAVDKEGKKKSVRLEEIDKIVLEGKYSRNKKTIYGFCKKIIVFWISLNINICTCIGTEFKITFLLVCIQIFVSVFRTLVPKFTAFCFELQLGEAALVRSSVGKEFSVSVWNLCQPSIVINFG